MNSRTKFSQNALACALGGVNTEDQLNILDNMHDFLQKFRVLHSTTGKIRTAKLPWEHGMLCSIKATKALYQDLVVNGPFEFLMTAKLNQDCLENLFSRIRGNLFNLIQCSIIFNLRNLIFVHVRSLYTDNNDHLQS